MITSIRSSRVSRIVRSPLRLRRVPSARPSRRESAPRREAQGRPGGRGSSPTARRTLGARASTTMAARALASATAATTRASVSGEGGAHEGGEDGAGEAEQGSRHRGGERCGQRETARRELRPPRAHASVRGGDLQAPEGRAPGGLPQSVPGRVQARGALVSVHHRAHPGHRRMSPFTSYGSRRPDVSRVPDPDGRIDAGEGRAPRARAGNRREAVLRLPDRPPSPADLVEFWQAVSSVIGRRGTDPESERR